MGIMQFMDRVSPLALDPAIALLGNEEQGLAIDFTAMRGFIRDRVTGANNWLGDPNAKLAYASPSAKWIWNAFGVLSSGTTLRCDHDPASLDSSVTPLNSMGIGAGAVVNKSIVLASGTFTYPVGEVVRISDATDISKWILGRVVSWTAGTKTLVIAGYAASAPYVSGSNWKVIVALGIRIESQRTNLFLNSAVGVTQNVTVTAVAHTLSFDGPGTVTLSGASTAGPLVGSSSRRSTLTFTPTAGVLTLTVTGDVRLVNLEPGAFASSYIQTTVAQVTRAADRINLAVTAFPYSGLVSVLAQQFQPVSFSAGSGDLAGVWSGSNANALGGYHQNSGNAYLATARQGGVGSLFTTTLGPAQASGSTKVAVRFEAGNAAGVLQGLSVVTLSMASMPTGMTNLTIGGLGVAGIQGFWLKSLLYIPRSLSNAELQGLVT